MTSSVLAIVSLSLKIASMLIGDSLLAKWLAALKHYLESQKDPYLSALVTTEYRKLQDDFKQTLDKDKPLP